MARLVGVLLVLVCTTLGIIYFSSEIPLHTWNAQLLIHHLKQEGFSSATTQSLASEGYDGWSLSHATRSELRDVLPSISEVNKVSAAVRKWKTNYNALDVFSSLLLGYITTDTSSSTSRSKPATYKVSRSSSLAHSLAIFDKSRSHSLNSDTSREKEQTLQQNRATAGSINRNNDDTKTSTTTTTTTTSSSSSSSSKSKANRIGGRSSSPLSVAMEKMSIGSIDLTPSDNKYSYSKTTGSSIKTIHPEERTKTTRMQAYRSLQEVHPALADSTQADTIRRQRPVKDSYYNREGVYTKLKQQNLIDSLPSVYTDSTTGPTRKLLYVTPSEINLGAIFRTYDSSLTLYSDGQDAVKAVSAAVDYINNSSKILPNTMLRVHYNDSLGDAATAETMLQWQTSSNLNLVGFLGGIVEEVSEHLASRLGTDFQKPLLAPVATSYKISNSTLYPLVARLLPSIEYEANALIDFAYYYGWNYIGILHTTDTYGVNAEYSASLSAARYSTMTYYSASCTSTSASLVAAMTTLQSSFGSDCGTEANPCVWIVFVEDIDMTVFFAEASGLSILDVGNVWLLSDTFDLNHAADSTTLLSRMQGTVGTTPLNDWWKNDQEFLTTFGTNQLSSTIMANILNATNICAEDSYTNISYFQQFGSHLPSCTPYINDQSFYTNEYDIHAPEWWDAVLTYAIALDAMISAEEDIYDGGTLFNYITAVDTFGASGSIAFESTGEKDHVRYTYRNVQSNGEVDIGYWKPFTGYVLDSSTVVTHSTSSLANPANPRVAASAVGEFAIIPPAGGRPPSGRFGTCMTVAKSHNVMVAIGGTDDIYDPGDEEVWHFDFRTEHWNMVPTVGEQQPLARHYAGCIFRETESLVYMFAGKSAYGLLNDLWEYDVENYRFSKITPLLNNAPSPRLQFCMAEMGENGFAVLGGITHNDDTSLWTFDYSTFAWSEIKYGGNRSVYDSPICGAQQVDGGYRLYIFGGFHNTNDHITVYDFNSGQWSELSSPDSSGKPKMLANVGQAHFLNGHLWFANGFNSVALTSYARVWSVDLTNKCDNQAATDSYCGVWSTRSELSSAARDSDALGLFGTSLIMFGGWGLSNKEPLNDMDVFVISRLEEDAIHVSFDAPEERTDMGLGLIGNRIYMFAGRSDDGPMDDLWYYNIDEEDWTQIDAIGTIPTARYGHSVAVLGPNLLVYGGTNGPDFYEDLQEYNSYAASWEEQSFTITTIGNSTNTFGPGLRAYHVSVDLDDITMLIHGGESDEGSILSDVWLYDLEENWFWEMSIHPTCETPTALTRCGADALGDKLYRVGGWDEDFIPSGELWQLTIDADREGCWSQLTSLPNNVAVSEAAVVVGGYSIYVYGGSSFTTNVDDLYIYNTLTSTWTQLGQASALSARAGAKAVYYGQEMLAFGGWGVEFDDYGMSTNYLNELFRISAGPLCDPANPSAGLCFPCSKGTYYLNDACISCPAGSYNLNPTSETCQLCERGQYNSFEGASDETMCIPCIQGTYADTDGSSSCLDCATDSYCPPLSFMEFPASARTSEEALTEFQPAEFERNTEYADSVTSLVSIVALVFLILVLVVTITIYCKAGPAWQMKLQEKDMFFDSAHQQAEYAPVISRKTKAGGIFSLLVVITMLLFAAILTVPFLLDNIDETRTLIPAIALEDTIITESLTITIKLIGYGEGESTCLQANTDDVCGSSITMVASNEFNTLDDSYTCSEEIGLGNTASIANLTVLLNEGETLTGLLNNCTLTYECTNCQFDDPITTFSAEFDEADTFAMGVMWEMTATTGYRGQTSSIGGTLFVPDDSLLMGTSSPTDVQVKMIDTTMDDTIDNVFTTGIHLAYTSQTIGTSTQPAYFHGSNGINVVITATKTDASMEVEVEKITETVEFLSNVMGSVVGLIGGFAFAMRLFEKYEEKWCDKENGTTAQLERILAQIMNKNVFDLVDDKDNTLNFYFDDAELDRKVIAEQDRGIFKSSGAELEREIWRAKFAAEGLEFEEDQDQDEDEDEDEQKEIHKSHDSDDHMWKMKIHRQEGQDDPSQEHDGNKNTTVQSPPTNSDDFDIDLDEDQSSFEGLIDLDKVEAKARQDALQVEKNRRAELEARWKKEEEERQRAYEERKKKRLVVPIIKEKGPDQVTITFPIEDDENEESGQNDVISDSSDSDSSSDSSESESSFVENDNAIEMDTLKG